MLSIATAAPELLAPYRDLQANDDGVRRGLIIAEGAENVRWLLQSSLRVHSVLGKATMAEALAEDLHRCPSQPSLIVDERQRIDDLLGYHFTRGILACAERPTIPTLATMLARLGPGPAGLVLCDTIHDHANVGATIRNARCFGLAGVILSDGCADPFFRKAVRVSVGHVFHLPLAWHASPAEAVVALRAHDFTVYAAHRGPLSRSVSSLRRIPSRWCVVLGNEDRGPQPATLAACQESVAIDMAPGVDSINVAAAGAVLMHAFRNAAGPAAD